MFRPIGRKHTKYFSVVSELRRRKFQGSLWPMILRPVWRWRVWINNWVTIGQNVGRFICPLVLTIPLDHISVISLRIYSGLHIQTLANTHTHLYNIEHSEMKRVPVLSEIAPYQQFSEPQNDPTPLPPESWCVTNCITFQKRNRTAVNIGKNEM